MEDFHQCQPPKCWKTCRRFVKGRRVAEKWEVPDRDPSSPAAGPKGHLWCRDRKIAGAKTSRYQRGCRIQAARFRGRREVRGGLRGVVAWRDEMGNPQGRLRLGHRKDARFTFFHDSTTIQRWTTHDVHYPLPTSCPFITLLIAFALPIGDSWFKNVRQMADLKTLRSGVKSYQEVRLHRRRDPEGRQSRHCE